MLYNDSANTNIHKLTLKGIKKMKTVKEKIPSLIISLILATLGFGLKYFGLSDQQSIIAATLILIISFIISINVYRPIRRAIIIGFTKAEVEEDGPNKNFHEFKEKITEIVGNSLQSDTAKNAGLSGWYQSIEDAESNLVEHIKNSKEIKLITNTGKSDLSKGSKYFKAISTNKNAGIKILISAADSPFISEKWATQNGFSKDHSKVWIKRVKDSISDLQYLQEYHKITLSVHSYKLPFIWHLWIFNEQTMFVTSWLPQSQNKQNIRMYKLIKTTDISLFDMFNSYFERVWNEQSLKLL
jgi:hypothetical protein